MKDFAKSIHVGNAKDRDGKELKVGDIVAVKTSDPKLNHGKIVRISGEQISVDVTGDDDIWTTPARQAVKMGNAIPNAQINGPSAAEVREIAGRVYKTDMRGEDLARAVSFELAKKYKSFQTNSHIMDMVKEVLSKFKTGNSKVGNASTFDRLDDAVHYASNLTDEALRRLNGTFSATNLISALSKCKQACDDAIKLAQQYDREINK